jgi:hypothetical protein
MQEEQQPSPENGSAQAGQPGQVFAPGAGNAPMSPQPAQPSPPPLRVVPQQEDSQFAAPQPRTPLQASGDQITWTASEYIAHEKTAGWYMVLAGAAAVLAALIYLFTRDVISPAVVIVSALLLGVYGARKPRELQYGLGPDIITIGDKQFHYGEFRSFSIIDDGAFSSIVFMPLKRFAPLLTIYYAPEDEDRIVAMLADRLPMDEHKLDAVDRLMRRIRF